MRGAVVADSVGKAFTLSVSEVLGVVADWFRELGATLRRVARI